MSLFKNILKNKTIFILIIFTINFFIYFSKKISHPKKFNNCFNNKNQKNKVLLYSINSIFYKINYLQNNITGTGDKLKDIPYKAMCFILNCPNGCCEGNIDNLICGSAENCMKYKNPWALITTILVPIGTVLLFLFMYLIFLKCFELSKCRAFILALFSIFIFTIPFLMFCAEKISGKTENSTKVKNELK